MVPQLCWQKFSDPTGLVSGQPGEHVLEIGIGVMPIHALIGSGSSWPQHAGPRRLPANSQLARPMAIGRIWFSIQLLPGMLFVRAYRRARDADKEYRATTGIGATEACVCG